MALKEFLILSRPLSGRVEGRTALIQLDYSLEGRRPWFRSTGDDPLGKGMKLSAKCEVAEISIPASEAVIQSRKKLEFGVLSLGFGPRVLYNPISGGSGGPL